MNCLFCSKELPIRKNTRNKYCSNKCQGQHKYQNSVKDWLEGDLVGYSGKAKQVKLFVRRYLLETRGTPCSECGWDKRHPDGSILTEIDHIDGDAENCSPDNLRILCPNCHALTPTFRARNKDSKRSR